MSAKIISERHKVTAFEYELFFQRIGDYPNNGFGFPCDEKGNLLSSLEEPALKNYEYAKEHTEKYEPGRVIKRSWSYIDNAVAECSYCGEHFELYDEYMGARECPFCGQWYNLFGQELTDPSTWDDEDCYDDY